MKDQPNNNPSNPNRSRQTGSLEQLPSSKKRSLGTGQLNKATQALDPSSLPSGLAENFNTPNPDIVIEPAPKPAPEVVKEIVTQPPPLPESFNKPESPSQ